MHKKLNYYFLILLFFMGMTHTAFAVDSTILESNDTSPHALRPYILYLSSVLHENDLPMGSVVERTYTTPSNLNCSPGFAACVTLQWIDSNNFTDPCAGKLKQIIMRSKIQKASNGGYAIRYRYSFTMIPGILIPGTNSLCDSDKGGNFTLTVTCMDKSLVNANALIANVNGVGPTCLIQ